MTKVPAGEPIGKRDGLSKYRKCPKCHAGLERLYLGGVGDWRHTIVCERCFHIQRGISFRSILVPLIAEQYGIPEGDVPAREQAAQREYEKALAEATDF